MTVLDYLSSALFAAGMFFFVAGTVALFRFPDLYCRLHAVTKADNVGLGLTVLALMLQAESWNDAAKLGLSWVMVLVASATVCFLVGSEAHRRGVVPWARKGD